MPIPCPPVIRGPDVAMPTTTKGGEMILPGPMPVRPDFCLHEDNDPADGSTVACVRKVEHIGNHLYMHVVR